MRPAEGAAGPGDRPSGDRSAPDRGWGEAPGLLLHQLVEEQAAAAPGRPAVTVADRRLSYGELDRAADRLAHRLAACGVSVETPVAMVTRRSLESFVALLAVLKAGGTYVPVDPDYPADRIAQLLSDAGAPLVLTQDALVADLPPSAARVLTLDGWDEIAGGPPAPRVSAATRPDNLAYVIYTSGSTGRPKGVMTTHHGVVNSTVARKDVYPADPGRYLMLSSLAFDSSIAGIFWTLGCGGHLLVPSVATQSDPALLAGFIAEHRISHLLCVPSLYQALVRSDPASLESLRLCVLAGEEWPSDLHERHRRSLPQALLSNEYGATEVSVWSTGWVCPTGQLTGPPDVGTPIRESTMYILDDRLRPVTGDAVGEAYLGGVGVGRGYLDRPALTARAYVPDPFSPVPGARMYRTGDLLRPLPGGGAQFLGRVDDQAKIRGHRVELGEIRARLCAEPDIADAVVVATSGHGAGTAARLAAYVVGEAKAAAAVPALDPTEVRARLARALPAYMVPHAVVVLPELPLTPNGKVDRQALPEPEAAGRPPYEAPSTDREQAIAEVFAEILGVTRVGQHDNFLELGGDSLTAMSIVARLRALDVPVSAQSVLASPTVRELALTRHADPGGATAASAPDPYPGLTVDPDVINRLMDGIR
ncbi:amino acid adenylation domain-containing protein [Streptomyces goshikiensis]|uniref:non-ribosomal peptide synthetase n=1 Tax=Streptomyces goshikiensis TaxID=1942 RepID=UPI00368CF68B